LFCRGALRLSAINLTMNAKVQVLPVSTPFDSIENAQDYLHLLVEAIADAKNEIAEDVRAVEQAKSERHLEALRLVHYKLEKLEQHMRSGSRALNDLRTLRRLLFDERP
jgi:flagellar biosynthesis chaperone FliJ